MGQINSMVMLGKKRMVNAMARVDPKSGRGKLFVPHA